MYGLDTPHENCLCSDQFDDSRVTCTQQDCTTDTDTPYTGCIIGECNGGVDGDPYPGCIIPHL